ncbi:MAG TPA: hypothetical protein PLM24_00090 [Methanothrix sp.]|nr:hypothetical protein [Methanothrix sp.]HPJ83486.1 hypothetical protein [Methanothrix sp.]HPR65515.1 hypothetical protein [Methanothrix sp.]
MTTAPRLLKGAIVAIDPNNPLASVTVFQYNPHTLTRRLEPQMVGGESRAEPLRIKGAPVETIDVEIEIDAADQLERGGISASFMGIYPQLSALEMLVYPKSKQVIANEALLKQGTIEIVPPEAPLTLFVWGPSRILPVQIKSFSITEEVHDTRLNPLQAKVSLSMRVLSYNDLPSDHKGHKIFLAHQVAKEVMATVGSVGNLGSVVGSNIKLL